MMYRRKTYDVDAMQWDGEWHYEGVADAVKKWAGKEGSVFVYDHDLHILGVNILDGGFVEVSRGDWLLKGADGEITACSKDFFNATFDPIIPASSIILPGLGARMQ